MPGPAARSFHALSQGFPGEGGGFRKGWTRLDEGPYLVFLPGAHGRNPPSIRPRPCPDPDMPGGQGPPGKGGRTRWIQDLRLYEMKKRPGFQLDQIPFGNGTAVLKAYSS